MVDLPESSTDEQIEGSVLPLSTKNVNNKNVHLLKYDKKHAESIEIQVETSMLNYQQDAQVQTTNH